jgi:hypothetical protein
VTLRLIYWKLTPWSRGLLEKLTVSQLVKKFPAFYGTRSFITAFTRARHLPLSWASWNQSMRPSHCLKIDFNMTLPSTPRSSKWSPSLWSPHQNSVCTFLYCKQRSVILKPFTLQHQVAQPEIYVEIYVEDWRITPCLALNIYQSTRRHNHKTWIFVANTPVKPSTPVSLYPYMQLSICQFKMQTPLHLIQNFKKSHLCYQTWGHTSVRQIQIYVCVWYFIQKLTQNKGKLSWTWNQSNPQKQAYLLKIKLCSFQHLFQSDSFIENQSPVSHTLLWL